MVMRLSFAARLGFKFPLPTSLTSSKRLTSLNLVFFVVKMIIIILASKGIVGIKWDMV